MKASMYSADGKAVREVELPAAFAEQVREDLIKRAVLSDYSYEFQPKGNYKWAGMETSARYRGRKEDYGSIKNHGIAMLPHEVLPKGKFGKVKRIPSAVKGRRAHPPNPGKILIERVNKKEYAKALRSAIAATASIPFVKKRGHKFEAKSLPIIFDASFEKVSKARDVVKALNAVGIGADLERAKKPKLRSGIRARGGGKVYPRSALIVTGADSPLLRAARNIAGVDAVRAGSLKAKLLAPGAHCGRLTIYTESALGEISKM